jgi:hypothetical protein
MPQDDFRIDVVLNFIHRFGEDTLFSVRDMLNEGKSQQLIARLTVDKNNKPIDATQLSRFIRNTYHCLYVVKPDIITILQTISEARDARIKENLADFKATILSITDTSSETLRKKT